MTDRENMVCIVGETLVLALRRCNAMWRKHRYSAAALADAEVEGIQRLACNLGFVVYFGRGLPDADDFRPYLWVDVEVPEDEKGYHFIVPQVKGGDCDA